MPKYQCPNCGVFECSASSDLRSVFPHIPDLLERIAPGEPVPARECPHCQAGALVHEIAPPTPTPTLPPQPLLDLIAAQPEPDRNRLKATPHPWRQDVWTITLGGLDHSSNVSLQVEAVGTESADLYFDPKDGRWYEGKPEVTDRSTEYTVGDIHLTMPDGFDLNRYQ